MTVKETLEQARALLAIGWMQGNFENCPVKPSDVKCYCIVGAVRALQKPFSPAANFTMGGDPSTRSGWSSEQLVAWDLLAQEACGENAGWSDLSTWNDHPHREKKEVLALIDTVLTKL